METSLCDAVDTRADRQRCVRRGLQNHTLVGMPRSRISAIDRGFIRAAQIFTPAGTLRVASARPGRAAASKPPSARNQPAGWYSGAGMNMIKRTPELDRFELQRLRRPADHSQHLAILDEMWRYALEVGALNHPRTPEDLEPDIRYARAINFLDPPGQDRHHA